MKKPKKKIFRIKNFFFFFFLCNYFFFIFTIAGLLLHLGGMHGMANFLLLMAILMLFHSFVLKDIIYTFQHKALPRLMNRYERLLRWVLQGKRPVFAFVSLFGVFVLA